VEKLYHGCQPERIKQRKNAALLDWAGKSELLFNYGFGIFQLCENPGTRPAVITAT